MSKKKSLKFKCWECGGNKLAFLKHVKCLAPVKIRNSGRLYYDPVIIDTSDYSKGNVMFCCRDCGVKFVHNNRCVRTAKKLRSYLENTSDIYFESEDEERKYREDVGKLMDRIESDPVLLKEIREITGK